MKRRERLPESTITWPQGHGFTVVTMDARGELSAMDNLPTYGQAVLRARELAPVAARHGRRMGVAGCVQGRCGVMFLGNAGEPTEFHSPYAAPFVQNPVPYYPPGHYPEVFGFEHRFAAGVVAPSGATEILDVFPSFGQAMLYAREHAPIAEAEGRIMEVLYRASDLTEPVVIARDVGTRREHVFTPQYVQNPVSYDFIDSRTFIVAAVNEDESIDPVSRHATFNEAMLRARLLAFEGYTVDVLLCEGEDCHTLATNVGDPEYETITEMGVRYVS